MENTHIFYGRSLQVLLEIHPEWQFWGEEGIDNITEYDHHKTYLFIVDPIEGTNNFKHYKDEQWGSVIGLVDIKTKKPIAGIVAHAIKRKFYVGIVGVGAFEFIYNVAIVQQTRLRIQGQIFF